MADERIRQVRTYWLVAECGSNKLLVLPRTDRSIVYL